MRRDLRKRQEEKTLVSSGVNYACVSGSRGGQVSQQMARLTVDVPSKLRCGRRGTRSYDCVRMRMWGIHQPPGVCLEPQQLVLDLEVGGRQ